MKTAFIIRSRPGDLFAEENAVKLAQQLRSEREQETAVILVPPGVDLNVYEPGMLCGSGEPGYCDCPECTGDE